MVRIEEIEARIADLQAQHAATLAAMAAAEAELVPLDAALEEARAIYQEVGTVLLRAQRAYIGAPNSQTHRAKSPAEYEQARQEARSAEVVFGRADAELGAALIRRNGTDGRRSDLLMSSRRIEAAIEQAEAELAKARRAQAEPGQDPLARIRARVRGGFGG